MERNHAWRGDRQRGDKYGKERRDRTNAEKRGEIGHVRKKDMYGEGTNT